MKAKEAQIKFYSKERTEDEVKDFDKAFANYQEVYKNAIEIVKRKKSKELGELNDKLNKAKNEFEKQKDKKNIVNNNDAASN